MDIFKMSRQEVIDSIEDPVDRQIEQDIYDNHKEWDYRTMDPNVVFRNRIAGILSAYKKAYPDMDFSEAIFKITKVEAA